MSDGYRVKVMGLKREFTQKDADAILVSLAGKARRIVDENNSTAAWLEFIELADAEAFLDRGPINYKGALLTFKAEFARQTSASPPVAVPSKSVSPSPDATPARRPANRPRNRKPVLPGEDRRHRAPYQFVPLPNTLLEQGLFDSPVLHDTLDLEKRWSGELWLTMTALTPLLAANDQFLLKDSPHLHVRYQQYVDVVRRAAIDTEKLEKKHVLEPLALPTSNLPDDSIGSIGPVLLSGAMLKGMLRQSLAAFTASPLERVAERTFSYRPNTWMGGGGNKIRKEKIGLVISGGGFDQRGSPLPATLLLFDLRNTLRYVNPSAEKALLELDRYRDFRSQNGREADVTWRRYYSSEVGRSELSLTINDCETLSAAGLFSTPATVHAGNHGAMDELAGFMLVRNMNGLDLNAVLHQRFFVSAEARERQNRSEDGYNYLLLNVQRSEREIELGSQRLAEFYETLEHLSDADFGHFRMHPLLKREEIKAVARDLGKFRRRGLSPGDLVVLEVDSSGNHDSGPMGHHVRYRQRYRDSVHRTAETDFQSKLGIAQQHNLRQLLCPLPVEVEPTGGPPRGLSLARRMLGYTGTSRGIYDPQQPTTFGIGLKADGQQTDYTQLAGRVAFNIAVEQIAEGRTSDADRFLNVEHQAFVPLKPLGSPKPSAVEHYLTQDLDRLGHRNDAGILCTYGDTEDDAAAGNLRGRKFYLHQPQAAVDPTRYALGTTADDLTLLSSDQAAIARFVSRPGTRFRVKMRFLNLDPWELGMLILALDSTSRSLGTLARRFEELRQPEVARIIRKWLEKYQDQVTPDRPLLAQKLGHGRPLGLGSVEFNLERISRLQENGSVALKTQGIPEEPVKALAEWLCKKLGDHVSVWAKEVLVAWLAVHRFAGRQNEEYPRSSRPRKVKGQPAPKPGKSPGMLQRDSNTLNFHSHLRSYHIEYRKMASPSPNQRDRYGLFDLIAEELPDV